jgi:uncharacterized protein (TIGR02271 family)
LFLLRRRDRGGARAWDQNTPARREIGSDREIRVRLTEERATLDKQTVVREQVNVGKRNV